MSALWHSRSYLYHPQTFIGFFLFELSSCDPASSSFWPFLPLNPIRSASLLKLLYRTLLKVHFTDLYDRSPCVNCLANHHGWSSTSHLSIMNYSGLLGTVFFCSSIEISFSTLSKGCTIFFLLVIIEIFHLFS